MSSFSNMVFPTLISKAVNIFPLNTTRLNAVFLHAQGRNCEHNYDDCLLNPCPEAYSCVDGINMASCLPPVTDAVPLATTVTNITLGSTTRVPTLTLNMTSTAEKSTGACR